MTVCAQFKQRIIFILSVWFPRPWQPPQIYFAGMWVATWLILFKFRWGQYVRSRFLRDLKTVLGLGGISVVNSLGMGEVHWDLILFTGLTMSSTERFARVEMSWSISKGCLIKSGGILYKSHNEWTLLIGPEEWLVENAPRFWKIGERSPLR